MEPMAMRVTEMGASEGCPVIGQIEVASPRGGQDHLAGNGADFLLVLNSRPTLEGWASAMAPGYSTVVLGPDLFGGRVVNALYIAADYPNLTPQLFPTGLANHIFT